MKRAKKKDDGGGTETQEEPQNTTEQQNKKERKKKNKKTSQLAGEAVGSEGGVTGRPERSKVEKRLLCLSVSPQTKLLVSPDSHVTWFDQVCQSTLSIL